ncbi:hypothetical protein HK097_000138 [Rhizophlyctis rosea]|uniref:Uncharacterized protein n=1 Tax=Rhizophlyctis rosea TaxID=64517 RepID=A0AAD5SI91_9FUNG|nr:hypothetical protein HK097_000138 [Rhizophlyctis rosea]
MTSRRNELLPNRTLQSPRSPDRSRSAVSTTTANDQPPPRERSVARRVQQEASNVPIVPSIVTVEAAQARMAQALHFGTGGDLQMGGDRETRGRESSASRSREASQPVDITAPETHAAEATRETLVTKGPMGDADPVQTASNVVNGDEGERPEIQVTGAPHDSSDEQPDHARRMAQIEMLKKRLLEAQQRSQPDMEGEQTQPSEAEPSEPLEVATPKSASDNATDAPSSPDVDKLARSIHENGRSKPVSRSTSRRRRRASSASTSRSRRRMETGSIDEEAEDNRLEVESITDSLHDSMRQAIEEEDGETDEEDDHDARSHASHSSAESMHVDDHLDGDELMDGELTVGVSTEDGLNTDEPIADDAHQQEKAIPPIAEDVGQPQDTQTSATTKPDTKPADSERPIAKPSLGPPRLSDENLFAKKELPTLPPRDNTWKRKSGASLLDFSGSKSMKPISALSALIADKKGNDNPFAAEYSFFSGKGESDPMRLKIYVALEDEPTEPLLISVKRDATVEEVIGYALYEYLNEEREPPVPDDLKDVVMWNMRIVEDDGTVDDDFPALERTRKIQKFAFDQFAICLASPEQVKQNERSRPPKPVVSAPPIDTSGGGAQTSAPAPTVFLKVHLYSTLEVKQTTTIQMPTNIPLSEVFEQICRKRKYDSSKYIMKMPDTKTDVPFDKTLEQLKVMEFCILKRTTGGAGDIFLRPPDEQMAPSEQPQFSQPGGYSNMYRQYAVTHKQLMGRHERLLTIDGDYVHVMAAENKTFFDTMKTASHHISTITSCRPAKKSTSHVKLVVQGSKGEGGRTYDLEAASQQEAGKLST